MCIEHFSALANNYDEEMWMYVISWDLTIGDMGEYIRR